MAHGFTGAMFTGCPPCALCCIPPPAPRRPLLHDAGGTLTVALRFVALAATTGALGAWVFGRFVVGRLPAATTDRQRHSLMHFSVRVAIWCSAVLMFAALIGLLRSPRNLALAAQAGAAAATGAALLFAPRRGEWPVIAEYCVAALAVIPAFLGHAVASQELRVVSVLVDVAHVAAAGAWVGALGLLTVTALRERQTVHGPALTAGLIVAFHPVAMVAAGTVFGTGLATAWLRMGAPVGIASSSYSGLFVAKLLLVGVTGALGAGHSKLATRRAPVVDMASLSRTLLAESLLAVFVLVVTAVLVGTPPIG